jgi:Swi5-dependent recombination DNA repair protein 1
VESRLEDLGDKDAELLDKLSRRRKEAELKAREVEKAMELVRQAARIESGKETSNEDLEKLVRKWKGACRIAAEELFELIRGRVDSMGGGAAWRETRQQNGWFDEETASERKKREEAGEGADEREELEGLEEVQESEDGAEQDEERVSHDTNTVSKYCKAPKLTIGRTSRCT